jgi:8-oxo-dGTP pyrophosphatase MutT (NUDIX family)
MGRSAHGLVNSLIMPDNDVCSRLPFRQSQRKCCLDRKAKTRMAKAGKLNGIGGKMESGESQDGTMIREFREETGVTIKQWNQFALLLFPDANVYVYRAFSDEVFNVESAEYETSGEEVCTVEIDDLWVTDTNGHPFHNVIPNLRWLIPLALENTKGTTIICYE